RAMTAKLQRLVKSRTAELQASEERQRVLLDINNAVVTCLDRESLFFATAAALRRVVPFDRAALVLHDPAKEPFKVLGVAGPVPPAAVSGVGTEWRRHQSRAGWILDHGEGLLTEDLQDAPPFVEHAALLKEGIRSVVSVPMTVKGKIIGTLNVGSREPGRYG